MAANTVLEKAIKKLEDRVTQIENSLKPAEKIIVKNLKKIGKF